MTLASKPFYTVADRILGSQFLEDIAEFFSLFQTMEKGFVAARREVARILGDRRTTFVVVTTLEAAPVHEAEFFIARAAASATSTSARSCSTRCCPPTSSTPDATRGRRRAAGRRPTPLAAELAAAASAPTPTQVARVLAEVGESFRNFQVVAKREAEQRAELAADLGGAR